MEASDFALLLKEIRERRQLTQEELAQELYVTVGTLSNWENARHRPVRAQRRRIEQIADALGLLDSFRSQRKTL
jgi:transcriptional regulator with XRE-family HTH domain